MNLVIFLLQGWNVRGKSGQATMLDKRRFATFKWLLTATMYMLLCVIAVTFTGCVTIWMFGGMPSSDPSDIESHGYQLLLPGNISETTQAYSYATDLPPGDEFTLIDIKDFRFSIYHDACNKTQPLLLTLIHSSPKNFHKRQAVRKTWAQYSSSVTVLFFVGLSPEFDEKLKEEDREYGDIIQGNFLDAYRNMTYKHVMALKYATYYCQSKSYFFKSCLYS